MSEFILTEAESSDNDKFSGDKKEDHQEYKEKKKKK